MAGCAAHPRSGSRGEAPGPRSITHAGWSSARRTASHAASAIELAFTSVRVKNLCGSGTQCTLVRKRVCAGVRCACVARAGCEGARRVRASSAVARAPHSGLCTATRARCRGRAAHAHDAQCQEACTQRALRMRACACACARARVRVRAAPTPIPVPIPATRARSRARPLPPHHDAPRHLGGFSFSGVHVSPLD